MILMLATTGDVIMDKELECQQAMRVINTAGNMVYAAVVQDRSANVIMRIVCYVEDGLTSPVTHGAIHCYFPTKRMAESAANIHLDMNHTATSVVMKGSGTEVIRECLVKMLMSLRTAMEYVYNLSFSTIDYAGMDYLRYHWDRFLAGAGFMVIEGTSSILDDYPSSSGLSKPEPLIRPVDEGGESEDGTTHDNDTSSTDDETGGSSSTEDTSSSTNR